MSGARENSGKTLPPVELASAVLAISAHVKPSVRCHLCFEGIMYPRQGVRSTGLSRTAGPGPAAPGHVLTTQAHTHLSQQSQATSLAHLNPTESVLTLTSTFAQGCLTPSSARAKHRARSALQKLSLGIRARESLCFGDLAETNRPTNQKKKKRGGETGFIPRQRGCRA